MSLLVESPMGASSPSQSPSFVDHTWDQLRRKLSIVRCISHPCFENWEQIIPVELPSIPFFNIFEWGKQYRPTLTLDSQQERYLFLKYNYARYQLTLRKSSFDFDMYDVKCLLDEMLSCENDLVNLNFPLVMTFAKKFSRDQTTVDDLIEEGAVSLLQAVRGFNVDRGFAFSTYLCRSLATSMRRFLRMRWKRESTYKPIEDKMVETLEAGNTNAVGLYLEVGEVVRMVLEQNLADLSEHQMELVKRRHLSDEDFSIDGFRTSWGVSRQTVYNEERRAMEKLRVAVESLTG